jgi:hypothetical protein
MKGGQMEKKQEGYAIGTRDEQELKKWHKPELKELVARRTDASFYGLPEDGGEAPYNNS